MRGMTASASPVPRREVGRSVHEHTLGLIISEDENIRVLLLCSDLLLAPRLIRNPLSIEILGSTFKYSNLDVTVITELCSGSETCTILKFKESKQYGSTWPPIRLCYGVRIYMSDHPRP